jgi:hypothetical protein
MIRLPANTNSLSTKGRCILFRYDKPFANIVIFREVLMIILLYSYFVMIQKFNPK